MKRYFGTDGIRGIANQDLTPELAFKLGQAAGVWLQSGRVAIGRDTRRSGPMLGAAMASGLCSVGIEVSPLGVVPTPAVSYACRFEGFVMGVVISASHNPAPDNGIKLFGADGRKLPDAVEVELERLMDEGGHPHPTGSAVGRLLDRDESVISGYMDFLRKIVPNGLTGMRIAVDGANGAAYRLGQQVLDSLGAEVVTLNCAPDGDNINVHCGATHPAAIQEFTVNSKSHIGVAFDGDADRAVFSDDKGRLINGDRTMGIWALERQRTKGLDPAVIVGTVMSNGGFEAFLSSKGIRLDRAKVGDKYVSERIDATGAHVGGEQSGHIIFPDLGPTGDGIATALQLFAAIKESGRLASEFFDDYEPWPQLLVNVKVASKEAFGESEAVLAAIKEAEGQLAGHGRINVRPSGTQPMVRVMVEADDYGLRDQMAEHVVQAMIANIGGSIYSKVDLTHALGD